jgi:hypothetical protein
MAWDIIDLLNREINTGLCQYRSGSPDSARKRPAQLGRFLRSGHRQLPAVKPNDFRVMT